jgi:putative RecB family exonuclease
MLMTVYSHSRLSCFEQCPQKFKLQYIDKVETEVEESIEALEKLYRDLQYQKTDSLEAVFKCIKRYIRKVYYHEKRENNLLIKNRLIK